jgi:CheY-like chemotaxis protein
LKLLGVAIKGRVQIRTTFAEDTPPIDGDSTQVHQALVNLVTNAAQAIGEGTGAIDVRVDGYVVGPGARSDAPELREGSYARVTVSDDGPGIEVKTLRRVFEPFFTTKPAGVGTGLGLSVVHGVMKGHGGAVTVKSEVGKGTTFELLFPAAAAARAVRAHAPVAAAPARRILFVDDDEALVFLARRAFSRLGHGVVAHSTAAEALEEFERRPAEFDVVVTDIHMPDLGSAALVRAMRRIRPDVRVVMTAGVLGPDDVALAQSLGVVQILEKPQSLDDLAHLIHVGV